MKKTTLSLLAIFLFVSIPFVFAQNPSFFIPQQELQPRYERLPQIRVPQPALPSAIRPGMQQKQPVQRQPQQRVQRYIAVDGRYIPVYEKKEPVVPTREPIIATDFAVEDMPEAAEVEEEEDVSDLAETITPELEIVQPEAQPMSDPLPQETFKPQAKLTPPQIADDNPDLPDYRRRYGQYLADLQQFEQTGEMPANEALAKTLKKMDSNTPIILYPQKPQ